MYTVKAYGYNTLWNLTESDDPVVLSDILVRNTSTESTAYLYIPQWQADVVAVGNFHISPDAIDATGVTGTLTSRRFLIDGLTLQTEAWSEPIDVTRIDYAYELETLAGNDWFEGSASLAGRDFIQGLGGNDSFKGYGDDSYGDFFYGGNGIDQAIFQGGYASYRIEYVNDIWDYRTDIEPRVSGWRVTDLTPNRDGIDNLNEVERLRFSDKNVALDLEMWDHAGSAYRLYKAAFDRPAEADGLGYWISMLDDGVSLQTAAYGFLLSDEFKRLYGDHVSDTAFVTKLYNNVLDRNPDQGGLDYWLYQLGHGTSREDALIYFSESQENIDNVAALVAHGVVYQEWLG